MKEVKMGVYTCKTKNTEETFEFKFYTDLTVTQKLLFTNSVTNLVVDENNYNSVIRDLVFDFYVIDIFTDISTEEFKQSPSFLNSVEQFLEETNIVDVVKANVIPALFEELNKAVDKAIEYKTGIHPSPIGDSFASLIKVIEKKVNEIDLNDMMRMVQKFASMTGELTPESIVNAYMNTDIHKNNVIEIEEAKKQRAEFAKDMDAAIKSVNNSNKKTTAKKTNKSVKSKE
jgi:hypothetical protein